MSDLSRASALCCAILTATTVASAQPADVGMPPGRLVDIGGRRLHLYCTGSGAPTVLLEAGASSFAIDWTLVQSEISRSQRVCSYDRAGSGWSDPRPDVETPARIAADFHALITASGEKAPFVLVGASAGGLYVRLYQMDHPQNVAGLVLVDPASEDRLFTLFEGKPVTIASLSTEQLQTTLPATAVPVPSRAPQTGTPFDRLPADLYRTRIALDQRLIAMMPSSVSADIVRESSEGQRAGLARLLASRGRPDNPLRNVPLVVLTRALNAGSGLGETHAALAALSTKSRHVVVPESGHEIHLFAPAAVAQAIRDVSTMTGLR